MKRILPVFGGILFFILQPCASAAGNWVPFQEFSYFNPAKEVCRSETLELVAVQLRSQGVREAELAKLKEEF